MSPPTDEPANPPLEADEATVAETESNGNDEKKEAEADAKASAAEVAAATTTETAETSFAEGETETSFAEGETETSFAEGETETSFAEGETETSFAEGETASGAIMPNDSSEQFQRQASSEVRMKAHLILEKVKLTEQARNVDSPRAREAKAARDEVEASAARQIIAAEAKAQKEKEMSKKKAETSEELSKRMQKLALERQKENRHERLRVIQSDEESHLHSVKTFQDLKLPPHLLKALFEMGFERPSAIQEEALPRILASPPRNVIGQAQSGSGKTAAFVLGMLYRITIDSPATVQALCVTPTRELAVQIFEKAVTPMAAHMAGLKVQMALSGESLQRGRLDAHMVVGTPGKVVDWLKRRIIDPKKVKVIVFDEADNMVSESGHRANSLLIKKQMPKKCQSLLFSATFPPEVITFAERMVYNPDKILVESGPEYLVLDVIKQLWVDCQSYEGGKLQFLEDIYSLLTIGQSIVFVGTKRDADSVHRTLTDSGYTCSLLHSGVDNDERDRTMAAFRKNESNVLITTNVLARGVDVDNVCLVVNYDVPVDKDGDPDFETYLHRIGRTGRFGRKGTAISLISDQRSIAVLAAIEQHFSTDGKEMIACAPPDPEALADVLEI